MNPLRIAGTALSLGLLIAMSVSCTTTRKDAAAESRTEEGHIDVGGGVRIYYRLLGSGPDTVVVIHGGPGFTMDYFLEDLRPLADDHVLLFYDQRGTGGSTLVGDSASLVADRFVDDLEALRKHFGIKRLRLLGHSWGTAIVALYAFSFPDQLNKIIAVGTLPLEQHQLATAFDNMEAARDSITLRQMRELHAARFDDPANAELCRQYYTLWFEPFYGDPARPAPSKGDFCAGTPESRRNKMTGVDKYTFQSLGEWDWRPQLSKVEAQTLIIHGEKDPLPAEGAQAWAEALQNSQLLLMDSIGHFPYIEAPEQFFKAVNEFLDKE